MSKPILRLGRVLTVLGFFVLGLGGTPQISGGLDLISPALAQQKGEVPGQSIGSKSSADMWRTIRRGDRGSVSLPDRQTGIMIQSEGSGLRSTASVTG